MTMVRAVLFTLILGLFGCREVILHDLEEVEANRLITQLHNIGLDASKIVEADGQWSVAVPGGEMLQAMKYLGELRLLRTAAPAPLSQSAMVATREDERFRFERALSKEIEYTLGAVDGVLETRVHLNLLARDPFFGQPLNDGHQATASVLIIAGENFSFSEKEVQSLVAGAAGLAPDQVSVLVSRSAAVLRTGAEMLKPSTYETLAASIKTDEQRRLVLQVFLACLVIGIGCLAIGLRKRRHRQLQQFALKDRVIV